MIRAEFSRRVKLLARARAGDKCEACHREVKQGQFHYDHITPAVFGDNRADNCRLICVACHRTKTARDMVQIIKSNRVRRKHGEHLARLAEKGKL